MFGVVQLREILMVFCLVVFGLVFLLMLVVAWRQYRRGNPEAPNFHGSLFVELCWAVAPLLMVLMLVWPTARAVLVH